MSILPSGLYEFGPFRLDVDQRVFARSGQVLPLAPKTFDLLVLLLQRPGHAFSKQELMSALWPDTFVEEANLSFQISTLRKALGDGAARWIETLPKHGYRFSQDVRGSALDRAAEMEVRPATDPGSQEDSPTRLPEIAGVTGDTENFDPRPPDLVHAMACASPDQMAHSHRRGVGFGAVLVRGRVAVAESRACGGRRGDNGLRRARDPTVDFAGWYQGRVHVGTRRAGEQLGYPRQVRRTWRATAPDDEPGQGFCTGMVARWAADRVCAFNKGGNLGRCPRDSSSRWR